MGIPSLCVTKSSAFPDQWKAALKQRRRHLYRFHGMQKLTWTIASEMQKNSIPVMMASELKSIELIILDHNFFNSRALFSIASRPRNPKQNTKRNLVCPLPEWQLWTNDGENTSSRGCANVRWPTLNWLAVSLNPDESADFWLSRVNDLEFLRFHQFTHLFAPQNIFYFRFTLSSCTWDLLRAASQSQILCPESHDAENFLFKISLHFL